METNTPITDALLAKGCSSRELVEHAQSLERQLREARTEVRIWREFYAAECNLDDLALDHPDHDAATTRLIKAAEALAELGDILGNIPNRYVRSAQEFAAREVRDRQSEVQRLRAVADGLAGALEVVNSELELSLKALAEYLDSSDAAAIQGYISKAQSALAAYSALTGGKCIESTGNCICGVVATEHCPEHGEDAP